MTRSTSITVIEKLIDLELLFKLKADLSRFKRKKQQLSVKTPPSEAA